MNRHEHAYLDIACREFECERRAFQLKGEMQSLKIRELEREFDAHFSRLLYSGASTEKEYEEAKVRYVDERLQWELDWRAIFSWIAVILTITVLGWPILYFWSRWEENAKKRAAAHAFDLLRSSAVLREREGGESGQVFYE